nr:MAG TPA: hypothetical protein [Caudoviricetes sp.]
MKNTVYYGIDTSLCQVGGGDLSQRKLSSNKGVSLKL